MSKERWLQILYRPDLGDLKPVIQAAYNNVAGLHSEQVIPCTAGWEVCIENTLEDAHVEHVHAMTLAGVGLKQLRMEQHGKHSMCEYEITDSRVLNGLTHLSQHFVAPQPDRYFHIFLYPQTCISSVGALTYSIQDYLPTKAGTDVLTRLYPSLQRADSPDLGFFFDNAAKFNRQVFEEDARMVEKIKRIRCNGEEMRPHLKRLEWFYHARWESYYEDNMKKAQQAVNETTGIGEDT